MDINSIKKFSKDAILIVNVLIYFMIFLYSSILLDIFLKGAGHVEVILPGHFGS